MPPAKLLLAKTASLPVADLLLPMDFFDIASRSGAGCHVRLLFWKQMAHIIWVEGSCG